MQRLDLTAQTSVTIRAPRAMVWTTLLAPETIPRILAVSEVVAPWRLGERFRWKFHLGEKEAYVEGFVHRAEPDRVLEYEFADPHSRDVLGIEDNIHRVTLELSDDPEGTRVVLTQTACLSTAAKVHAEGGWRLALGHFKRLVEQGPRP